MAADILDTVTVHFQINQSVSDPVFCNGVGLIRLAMPAAWDAANITVQSSMEGVTYNDLYDKDGNVYTITTAASRSIILPPADFAGIRYLKLRSGTPSVPVAQTAARDLTLVTRPV